MGDGVQLWPRILADVEFGCLQPRYAATYDSDYRHDPVPRRSILPRSSFLTTTSLIATRGCHNRCGFCYLATDGLRMPYRMRDPRQVAAEFLADDQPYAVLIDNNLGSNREYLGESCRALEPLNKIWSAAVTIDVTDDPALIRSMALSGCTGVFVGLESLADQNLSDARKKTPKTADYARRVRMFHDHDIQVNGSFVLGFDQDRKDVFTTSDLSVPGDVLPLQTSNRFWQFLIKHHLVHAAWRPLVQLTRLRHLRFRRYLSASETLNRRGAVSWPREFSTDRSLEWNTCRETDFVTRS
jgi:Radical SAM superfamily